MEYLDDQANANVKLFENMLRTLSSDADISQTKCRLGGLKFKIVAETKRMFLSFSLEYLSDQNEARIRRDFKSYEIVKVLKANPGKYFQLSNNGFRPIPAKDVAS